MDTDEDMCSCPADMAETDARDDDDPLQRDGRREADLLMISFRVYVPRYQLMREHEAKEPAK